MIILVFLEASTMSGNWRAGFSQFAIALFLGGVTVPCWNSIVLAQIIPDETLGNESSVVTPDNIKGLESDRISGGATRGSNLFHSFREFNIGEGRGGYFENPAAIENIFSRVTGSNPSNILGRLGVLGDANLFFLNPNGILFGPKASLDIRGSFLATTADSIVFPDGNQFSATNPEAPPLLTVNVQQPIGLEFEGRQGVISNLGNLNVDAGQNLALVGGDVTLDGGSLIAPGGRVELGGLSAAGEIGLSEDGSLSFPDDVARGDVSLSNNAFVDVSADGGGHITVNARNLEIISSVIVTGIQPGLGMPGAKAEDIEINATDRISLKGGGAAIANEIENNAIGNGGDININTGSIYVTNGAQISASTFGLGDAGSLIIKAIDTVSFNGKSSDGLFGSLVGSTVGENAIGQGGSIEITTGKLSLTNGAQLIASTRGKGDAGTVIINADTISFDELSAAFSNVGENGEGNAGNININTSSLSLTNGAQLAVSTLGKGDAGSIIIDADIISFDRGTALSTVGENAIGKGGSIEITTGNLSLTNGAQLQAITFGNGDAGSVIIRATDNVSFDGERISDGRRFPSGAGSTVEENAMGKGGKIEIITGNLALTNRARLSVSTFGKGDAGNIEITTGNLALTNRARLSASTLGKGEAGSIIIQATDTVSFDELSAAFSTVGENAIGQGGSIEITTKSLLFTNGSQLQANTSGQGNAGNVILNVDTVSFDGVRISNGRTFSSAVFSNVQENGEGNAGNININTSSLSLTNGAKLSVSTFGKGDAGSVIINAIDTVSFDGVSSQGFSSAVLSTVAENGEGNAGNININTSALSLTNGAQLAASTLGKGDAGSVIINADTISINGFSSAVFSTVEQENAVGNGGNIEITTGNLSLTNGAQLLALTRGKGDAGNVIINADTISFEGFPSGAFSDVIENASGKGGNIEIATGKLFLINGGELNASTGGEGKAGSINITANTLELSAGGKLQTITSSNFDAGNITLKVEDSINLAGEGSGIFANTEVGSRGNGGSIIIDPSTVIVSDEAQIAVNSDGSGIGGDINLQAGSLTLDKGTITAETASNQGGNINLSLSDLLTLRNKSKITATAGTDQEDGDGGNIIINTPFIISSPFENSDITANASFGDGGQVEITSQRIFGISKRDDGTDLSDITVSSEFGQPGEVKINTSAIDPTRGLNNLPQEAVEAEVAQGCQTVRGKPTLEFFDIGRGGLPPTPEDLFSSEIVIAEWISLDLADEKIQAPASETSFTGDEVNNMTLLTAFPCQSK